MSEMQDSWQQSANSNSSTDAVEAAGSEAVAMPAPAPVIGTSVGRCLLEARKARGLTISDVAQAIKFSPRQIEAIESDAFDALPGITFVRGFIRSYSKWLRLDPDALLEMFNKQVPQVAATMQVLQDTGASLPQAGGRRNHFASQSSPLLLISVLLAVVAVVAAYLFWPLGKPGPATQPLPAPADVALAAAAMPAPSGRAIYRCSTDGIGSADYAG